MSRALAIAIAILTSLHSYVSAQAPSCLSGYDWSFNSLKQSPCTMTEALGRTCVNGQFPLAPLSPDFVYLGPTPLGASSCRCSTVYYSLLSACAYCQNETYLDWSIYSTNCTTVYDQWFLEPIPSSIVVPHYAYLDVKIHDSFNVVEAQNAGGPESSPVPQPSGTSTTPSAYTTTSVATPSKKVNIGAIVGGVVGGVAVIGIIAGLITFMIMRRRKNSASNSSTYNPYASPQTMTSDADMKYNSTPVPIVTSGNLYDPNDPTTFPFGYNNGYPNDGSVFPSDPVGYNPYLGSPQGVTPTITGNATLAGGAAPVPYRTTQHQEKTFRAVDRRLHM